MRCQKISNKSLPSTSRSSSTSQPTYPAMECEDSFSEDLCCGALGCNEKDIRKLFTPPSFGRIYYGWPEEGTVKACMDCLLKAHTFHNPSTNATEERDVLYGLQREDPDPTDHSHCMEILFESINQLNDETNQNDDTSPPTLDYEEMCVDEEMDVDDTEGESVNRHQQNDDITQESIDEILDFVASGCRETSVPKLTNENVRKDSRNATTKIQPESGKINATLKDPVLRVLTSSYRTATSSNSQLRSEEAIENAASVFFKMHTASAPQVGDTIFAMNDQPLKSWLQAEVIGEEINPITQKLDCVVVCESTNGWGKPVRLGNKKNSTSFQFQGQLNPEQMAYSVPAPHLFPVGTRVIAKFRNDFHTYKKLDREYYSGIVGEEAKPSTKERYLIFFDDGSAQYVNPNDVFLIYHKSGLPSRQAYPGHFKFIQTYLKRYFQWPLVRLPLGGLVSAEWNGKWLVTRVLEQDCSLAKLQFESYEKIEWVYLGSGRIRTIYNNDEQEILSKLSDPYQLLEFQGSIKKLSLPSHIARPKKYIPHECDSGCGIQQHPVADFKLMSPLAIPLFYGWDREENQDCEPVYWTPCGIKLHNYTELKEYLTKTKSSLTLDLFCFDSKIKVLDEFVPARVLLEIEDVSEGKEERSVQAINSIDEEHLPNFEYISKSVVADKSQANLDGTYEGWSCKCSDNCQNERSCSCWNSDKDEILTENEVTSYENKRLMTAVCGGVYECTGDCQCDRSCPNRVVQDGIKYRLQIFKTMNKGWGVRSIYDIPKGAFICSYPGLILSESAADKIPQEDGFYLATLSYTAVTESKKKRGKKVVNSSPAHSELDQTIDARIMGNVGRFINHSCDPNVFMQRVHFSTTGSESESQFAHLAFFAACSIKAGSELSFDYKYQISDKEVEEGDGIECYCQSPYCRKRLL
ncbi:unnamed protein product [Orchesella dallaii]|uniref:Histone-lysine N-methyltransferase eggless n=1 Tax=Orchesella dallaii TaxID=48710 RepID=A0ABP1QJE5_9HEXA